MSVSKPPLNTEIIQLQGRTPFGIGGRRACYTHPQDLGKCVKVLRTDDLRTIRCTASKSRFARFRPVYDNNADEQQALDAIYRQLGPAMRRHFPQCYGVHQTDLGPGLVLDLVRDHDGQISCSLRELLTSGIPPEEFRPAFDEFASFLLDNLILTRNLLDHNLVASRLEDGQWRLYLIDGFGDSAWISFGNWIPPIARKRIRSRIERVWPRLEAFYQQGGVSEEVRLTSNWDQGFLRHRGQDSIAS